MSTNNQEVLKSGNREIGKVETEREEQLRAAVDFYSAPGRVLLLDPMCQPVASEMQEVIQFQKAQLERAGGAIKHCLIRIGSIDQVQHHLGVCTETFERLTDAFADIANLPVDQVREDVIPGSACFHRRNSDEH